MKYWKTENIGEWLYVSCPIMDTNIDSFAVKRKLVEELKQIEKSIKSLRGWIGYTKLKNSHIMIMYLKFGAIPYKIEEDRILFKKELL